MSGQSADTGDQPLAGIRVADFGQFVAGPAVGQALVELGATVIKVEPLDGEPVRVSGPYGQAMLRTNNRSKFGLAVDLRQPQGRGIGERLIDSSDVVVQNMRPGAMHRLGLGPEQATARNPRLVYVSITGYGRDAAPSRSGLDVAVQAEAGIMSVTGEAESPPQRVGFTVVDQATAYVAVNAVLAALFRRERTGRGAMVDTSLLEVGVHAQGANWIAMFDTGVEPHRCGTGQPNAAPAAEVIAVRDGSIVLSAYTPAHWLRLCAAIGRPDLPDDPRFATNADRLANRAALCDTVGVAVAHLTMAEAVDYLGSQGVVAGAVRSYNQVLASADVQRLGIFRETEVVDGTSYRYASSPYTIRGVEPPAIRPAPAVGEHTRPVLQELGFDDHEIDALRDSGVVAEGLRVGTT